MAADSFARDTATPMPALRISAKTLLLNMEPPYKIALPLIPWIPIICGLSGKIKGAWDDKGAKKRGQESFSCGIKRIHPPSGPASKEGSRAFRLTPVPFSLRIQR